MDNNNIYYILKEYIKKNIINIVGYCSFILIFSIVFYLYSINLDAILYGTLLFLTIAIILISYDFYIFYKQHINLTKILDNGIISITSIPLSINLLEKDYIEIINQLLNDKVQLESKAKIKYQETIDYYTMWVHQIKTPISAMRLLLQSEENCINKKLTLELFKIEQYVEMVLCYLRLEDMYSDLRLEYISLSKVIKQAIRKYSTMFIYKKMKLEFNEPDCQVLSDEKWLVFAIEQILSNALKYTNEGTIFIYMDKEKEKTLVIEDTGIGIRQEDIPRVFERGFTGFNGRQDKKSTGIGLYLCKSILTKLSHSINITSEISKGTKVYIDLSSIELMFE
ncbi:sensor histidine kinase [Sedimentibacter sp. MB31-C6]|uniref:sensor histidine kinase n=1 Tax=Sedimentibacter sp. MB31-C6 TaxID=3109366 RepID=UPI002DDCE4AC|nr:sensor histidine kinase [Sedimentibacter sp. MB36-C1]WSI04834.1 sensor histidine kinase [Sedimentibacter sp. MB36-C1]